MKRFALFGGDCYYARGGFNDFVGNEDTKEECERTVKELKENKENCFLWWHIVDLQTLEIVSDSGTRAYRGEDRHAFHYHVKALDGELVPVNTKPDND